MSQGVDALGIDAQEPRRIVHSQREKAPAIGRRSIRHYNIAFGLQVLVLASHMPLALVQAACVFAAVTSPAAKVGAAEATASPRATIAA
jgi:hypothetical protein